MTFYDAVFAVDRDPREVAYMLIRACELVEQSCFSAVLISDESKCQSSAVRNRIFSFLLVISSLFTEARMFCLIFFIDRFAVSTGLIVCKQYLYLLCI